MRPFETQEPVGQKCTQDLAGAIVTLRPLPFRIPVMPHPEAHQVEQQANEWARETLGPLLEVDVEAALARRSPSWLEWCFPTASYDQLLHLWKLDQVYFLFDDACMTGNKDVHVTAAYCRNLAAQLQGRNQPITPMDRIINELVHDITDDMGPGLRERTLEGMAVMLRGFADQVVQTDQHACHPIDWDTALTLREHAVGTTCYLPWTEYIAGLDMTTQLDQVPLLRRLARLAGLQTLYVNELCSFRAEHFADDHGSLICVMLTSGATLQESFDLVAGHAAQAERDFLALCATALTGTLGDDADVRAYLQALGHLISGATYWQYNAIRYHGPHFRASPDGKNVWRLQPDHTELMSPG